MTATAPLTAAPRPEPLVTDYRPTAAFDEMVDGRGQVRPHWTRMAAALDALGTVELDHRRREVGRLLRSDGVTYNVYDDPAGPAGRWSLDLIPVLVSSDEWAVVEHGLVQRAELLNLILADMYGERRLIRKGLVPPEVIHAHRGFLRTCDTIRLPGEHQLIAYAADLVRRPDGRLCVLADLAQAPSGAGYAMENRLVTSRVMPSLYRDAQVHRLAPFFRALRTTLAAVAPPGIDDPRVVVLTPGPFNETYFEHAALASNLGYPLVEGDDLTVRNGRVYLRSLGGLEPVDVVLRRVDGWWCDPLELRHDSQLGVAGLVEASRRGRVSVVNTIGASVVENAGLLPFLPDLCEHLLGEPLALPQVPARWCGDAADLAWVLDHLDEVVISGIARRSGRGSLFGWELSGAELDQLRQRIIGQPHLFVGKERIEPSTTPTLVEGRLEPRATVMRSFAVARGDGYVAMPGGLARVAAAAGTIAVTSQSGAPSKDVWVLASEPEAPTGFWLQQGPGVEAIDPAGSMPSRAAENLFWLGRYAERAEDTVRLLRCVLDRRTEFQGTEGDPADDGVGGRTADDQVSPGGTECLDGLLGALTDITTTAPGFHDPETRRRPEAELLSVILDHSRAGSLASSLASLLQSANNVRDQLSVDTWLVASELDRELVPLRTPRRSSETGGLPANPQAALAGVLKSLLALAGLGTESMIRDPGWLFMDAGRRIERAVMLLSLLRATLVEVRGTAAESLMIESVLIAAESIITYRRRYRSQGQVETLLDLLIADRTNPRSLAFQLARLDEAVNAFPRPDSPRLAADQRLMVELSATVRLADTAELAAPLGDGRPVLELFLTECIDRLLRLADAIESEHFTHLSPRPLVLAAAPGDGPAALVGDSGEW